MIKNRSDYSLQNYLNCYYQKEPIELEFDFSKDQLFKKFYKYEKAELKSTINSFKHLLNENVDMVRLKKDMMWCKYVLKSKFDEYFMLDFINKNESERLEFITNGFRHRYFNYLNDLFYQKFYRDKYETYKKYKKFYKREMMLVCDSQDFDKFKSFIYKHNIVIKKPYNRSLGIGIEIIKKLEVSKNLFKRLLKESGKFILEELIEQSDEMSKLHPQSVNTIRVYGYIDDDNSIKICFPFIKMGVGNSVVDNGGAGGIFAAISDDGVVISDGIDELGNKYIVHPDTNVIIKGFKLPDWKQAINIVKSASGINKHTRLIGRDLAHTNDGWVVVEGNGKGHFLWQIAMQKGMKKELEKMIHWESVKNKETYNFGSRIN